MTPEGLNESGDSLGQDHVFSIFVRDEAIHQNFTLPNSEINHQHPGFGAPAF